MISINAVINERNYNLLNTIEYFDVCEFQCGQIELTVICPGLHKLGTISHILTSLRSLPLQFSTKLFVNSDFNKFVSMEVNIIHSSDRILSLFKNKLTIVCDLAQFDQLWFRERIRMLKYNNVDAPLIPYSQSLKIVEMHNSNSLHIDCEELERFSVINLSAKYVSLENIKESHLISGNIGTLNIKSNMMSHISCTSNVANILISAPNGIILSTFLQHKTTWSNYIDLIFENEKYVTFKYADLFDSPDVLPTVRNSLYKSGLKKSIINPNQQIAILLDHELITKYF